MGIVKLLYIFAVFILVSNGLQIKETYNLTTDLYTAGSPFELVNQSVIFLNWYSELVKMNIADQSIESLDGTISGFALFNSSVGVLVEQSVNGDTAIRTFNPADLALGEEPALVLPNWNYTTLSTVPNSADSIVYAFVSGADDKPEVILQIDVASGKILEKVAPCTLSNGTIIPIQSFQPVKNPLSSEAPGLFAIMCFPDENDESSLVFLDVKTWTVSQNYNTRGESVFLHSITEDIVGYVVFVNETWSPPRFNLVAYSVSIGSIEAATICDLNAGNGNTTLPSSAIGDGKGSSYISILKFNAETNAYGSAVIQATYNATNKALTISGSVSSTDFWFNAAYPNSFTLAGDLYLWSYHPDSIPDQKFVVVGN